MSCQYWLNHLQRCTKGVMEVFKAHMHYLLNQQLHQATTAKGSEHVQICHLLSSRAPASSCDCSSHVAVGSTHTGQAGCPPAPTPPASHLVEGRRPELLQHLLPDSVRHASVLGTHVGGIPHGDEAHHRGKGSFCHKLLNQRLN